MKEKLLYALWGCLYVVCAGLGFVTSAEGFGKLLLVLTAVIFFIPGAILLYRGLRDRNKNLLLRVRILSICSLSLTLILLVANIFSVAASEAVGNVLHVLLVLVSAPMFCGQYWMLSLFLWACLLMGSFPKLLKKRG